MVQLLVQHCSHLMDRFPSVEDDATFKRLLATMSCMPGLLCFIMFFFLTAIRGGVFYASEAGRDDHPFCWQATDPRSATFGIELFTCLFSLAFVVVMQLRTRLALLRSRDWEVPWIVAAVVIILLHTFSNRWHMAAFYRRNPATVWLANIDATEQTTLYTSEAFTLGACLCFPVRCCILWVLPVCSMLSFALVSLLAGSPFHEEQPVNLCSFFIMCGSAYLAALIRERAARITLAASSLSQDSSASRSSNKSSSNSSRVSFTAQVEEAREKEPALESESRMLMQEQDLGLGVEEHHLEVNNREMSSDVESHIQALREARCEIILKIGIDLRVFDSGAVEEAFFGKHMEGRLFTSMISQGHKNRFVRLLNKIHKSRSLHSLSLPLIFASGAVKHRLLVVDTGCAEPRYLIGVATGEVSPHLPGSATSALLLPVVPIPSIASSALGLPAMMAVPSVASSVRTVPSVSSQRSHSSSSDRHSDRPSGPAMPSEASGMSASAAFSWSINSEGSQTGVYQLRDQGVQAETTTTWEEAGTDTLPVSGLQAVPCRCVDRGAMRPRPLPPAGLRPGQQAPQPLAPVSGGAFDGRWLLVPGSGADVREWLQTFVIRGDVGIDGIGRAFNLEKKEDKVMMKGGALSFDGRVLNRDGKSGVRLQFVRVDGPEGPDTDSDDDDRISLSPTVSGPAPVPTPAPETPPPAPATLPGWRRLWPWR